jgi:hypothetical protein
MFLYDRLPENKLESSCEIYKLYAQPLRFHVCSLLPNDLVRTHQTIPLAPH